MTFTIGKVSFSNADWPFLLGNLLIIVGFAIILFFSLAKPVPAVKEEVEEEASSSPTEKNMHPWKFSPDKKEILGSVVSPQGRRSSRLQTTKDKTPVKGKKLN